MKLTNAITTPVVVPTAASSLQDTDVHHVMILKHGITGNHKEMGYVKESLERHFQHDQEHTTNEQQTAPSLLVHSATCNDHNSLDGIQRGGLRLATEINTVLHDVATNIVHEQQQQYTKTEGNNATVTANSTSCSSSTSSIALSIIGNSMGGLYARYALKYIDWIVRVEVHNTTTTTTTMNDAADDDGATTTSLIEIPVIPNIFVTTATPHLGVHGMTYWNVPACIVPYVGRFLGQSVADLFRQHEARPALPAAAKTTTEDGSVGGNNITPANNTVPSHYDIMEDDEDAAAAATDDAYKTTTEESRYHDILEQMTFDPAFLDPLARFKRRIAYANAYSTDIAVSTETAAFISDNEAHTAIGHDGPTATASSTTTTNQSYLSSLWNCYYAKRHNRINDEAEDEKDDDDDITSQSSMDPAASLLLPVHVIADDDIEEEAQHNERGESAPSSHFFVAGKVSSGTSLEEEERCTHAKDDNHSNAIVVDDVGNTAADHDTSISVPAYSSIRFDTPKSTTSTKRYTNTHDIDREASSLSDDVPPFAAAAAAAAASASELATNLDSLGWTKYFVDNRSLIPSLSWKTPRPNLNRGHSWDGTYDKNTSTDTPPPTNTNKRSTNSLCYSSSELKKQFCPNVWDWTTLPFGHSFLIASTRDQIHEMLYKTARPFVDEVIVKEVLKEMLEYN